MNTKADLSAYELGVVSWNATCIIIFFIFFEICIGPSKKQLTLAVTCMNIMVLYKYIIARTAVVLWPDRVRVRTFSSNYYTNTQAIDLIPTTWYRPL